MQANCELGQACPTEDMTAIHCCYDRNPSPFLLWRLLEQEGKRDLEFLYANPAFEAFAGLQNHQIAGKTFRQMFTWGQEQDLYALCQVGVTGEPAVVEEFRDGFGRILQVSCFPVTTAYCGCTFVDRSAEYYLQRMDSRELAMIHENVAGGLFVMQLQAPNRIVYANQTLCQMLGYPEMTFLSLRPDQETELVEHLIVSQDLEKFQQTVANLPCNQPYQCIFRMKRCHGGEIWVAARGRRAMPHDMPPIIISVVQDITAEMDALTLENRMKQQVIQNLGSQYYAAYYLYPKTSHFERVYYTGDHHQPLLPASGDYRDVLHCEMENLVHPEDLEDVRNSMSLTYFRQNACRQNGFLMLSVEFRRRTDTRLEWTEMLICSNQTDPAQDELITIAFRNIHEQKMAEYEKRYLDVFSYAVAHSYEAVLEYDVATNTLYELTIGDNGLYRAPRYAATMDESLCFARKYIHPEDAERFVQEISARTIYARDLSHSVTFEFRRRAEEDGEYRWCAYSMRAFQQNNRRVYILFVKDIHADKMRNLRQQKRLQIAVMEAERRASEKNDQLFTYYGKTIELMSSVVEYRSLESGVHVRRIKQYTEDLLRAATRFFPEQELDDGKISSITEASALHDVGKIGVPDNILLKPARLTHEEFEVMKRHTIIGADIAREIPCVTEKEDEYLYGYYIARYHHERYDGKGYPDGLKGEDIPFCAQIVAIADVFDALTTERVYKEAYTPDRAYEMILGGECGVFSARLLDCFCSVREQFSDTACKAS